MIVDAFSGREPEISGVPGGYSPMLRAYAVEPAGPVASPFNLSSEPQQEATAQLQTSGAELTCAIHGTV